MPRRRLTVAFTKKEGDKILAEMLSLDYSSKNAVRLRKILPQLKLVFDGGATLDIVTLKAVPEPNPETEGLKSTGSLWGPESPADIYRYLRRAHK